MSSHSEAGGQGGGAAVLRRIRGGARQFAKAFCSWRTLVIAAGVCAMLALFSAAIAPVRYDITIGMVPAYTITANRDVVDEITTEQRRMNAAALVTPTYHYAEGVTESVLLQFDQVFTQMDAAIQYSHTLPDYSATRRYSADEIAYARGILTLLDLRDYQMRTLLNTSREDLTQLYNTLYVAVQNTMASNVTQGAENEAITSVMQIVGYRVDTSLLQNVVLPLLKTVIVPNMVIDQEATQAARQLASDSVEPVVYKQGQNIVVKGQGRVERYQYDILSNLGLLSDNTVDMDIYLGAALLMGIMLLCALLLLRVTEAALVQDIKRLSLVFTAMTITLGLCIIVRLVDIYLAPIVLCALLLSAMLGTRAGVIANAALAVLVSALAAGGSTAYTDEMVQLLVCSLASGTLAALITSRFTSRLRVLAGGIAAGVCNFFVLLALGLMTSSSIASVVRCALWCAGGGLLSGVLCLGVQPLLEVLFNLPTPTKLMELSNPNHPLLRRLLLEAPGTYHHSIIVANLAEAAAEAVGANPLLARVGGYYHDVGKLRRPQFFRENQLGIDNKLDETDTYTAAQIVLSHTRDGVTLARNYHLPREVLKIIGGHHGNTPAMFFYARAVKESGGKPVNVDDYRYDADPPDTKECAIVLLCDTIEAAVRSMQNPTPEAIEEFIIKLIRGKLQDGQLSNCPLTLRDIDEICAACATVIGGVFHERIEYPDAPQHLPRGKERAKGSERATLWGGKDGKKAEKKKTKKRARSVIESAEIPAPDDASTDVPERVTSPAAEQPHAASTVTAPADAPLTAPAAAPVVAPAPEDFIPADKPVLVVPEAFEPTTPLPLVEPPLSDELLSVNDVLLSEEKAEEADAEEGKMVD